MVGKRHMSSTRYSKALRYNLPITTDNKHIKCWKQSPLLVLRISSRTRVFMSELSRMTFSKYKAFTWKCQFLSPLICDSTMDCCKDESTVISAVRIGHLPFSKPNFILRSKEFLGPVHCVGKRHQVLSRLWHITDDSLEGWGVGSALAYERGK